MLLFYLSILNTKEEQSKFEKIYYDHIASIYNIAFGFLKDDQLAKEMLSRSLESIARNIDNICVEDQVRLKNYIYKVVKNHCYNYLNSKYSKTVFFSLDNFSDTIISEDFSDSILGDETYKQIVTSIYALPEIYRDVLSLHYVDELSDKVIADTLGRPIYTVRSQIQRGTKLLQNILKEKDIV